MEDTPPGTPEWWEKLRDAMAAAGEELLGYKKSLREVRISDHSWKLINDRKTLHQMRHKANSNSNAIYQEYVEKDRKVKRSAQKDKRAWTESQAEAEGAAAQNDVRAVYQIAKKITGSSKASTGPAKAKDSSLLSKGEDKLARWAEHFKEVLNQPEPASPRVTDEPSHLLPIDTSDFTEDEVRKATENLKKNKPPGMDGITAEMLKAGREYNYCQVDVPAL